jgi:hypothetical protein
MSVLSVLKRPTGIMKSDSRDRLRAAIAARDKAQQEINDAQSRLERFQSIVKAGDDAAREAAKSMQRAKEARTAWVRGGCNYSGARELQALDDAGAAAAQAAERTARDADAVSKELARAESVVRSTQVDVGHREHEIATSVGIILAAEIVPELDLLERLANDYRATRIRIMALKRLLDPDKPSYMPDAQHTSGEAHAVIEAALTRATIKSWDAERKPVRDRDFLDGASGRDEAMIEQLTSPWRARAALLRENPDA